MRAMLPHTEGILDRDGIAIHYEIYGDGPDTILFVPTWSLVHSRVYKAQIPYFSDRFRVIAYDPRGNGRSGRPADPQGYALEAAMGDALAVLDAANVECAILFGLSFSGMVGSALAAFHPDRVRALISIAGATSIVPPHPGRYAEFEGPVDARSGGRSTTVDTGNRTAISANSSWARSSTSPIPPSRSRIQSIMPAAVTGNAGHDPGWPCRRALRSPKPWPAKSGSRESRFRSKAGARHGRRG